MLALPARPPIDIAENGKRDNLYVICQITAKPVWWLLLLIFCPFINFIVMILLTIALAKSFDKGTGFALGMVFLPFVFYPMLGFSDATYTAPQS